VSQGTLPHHFSTNSVKVIAIVIIVPSVSTIRRLFAMKIPAIMKVTEEDHHQT
jgi:hypothetical protein